MKIMWPVIEMLKGKWDKSDIHEPPDDENN